MKRSIIVYIKSQINIPDCVQATHSATFPGDAESCEPDNEESASQTGVVDVISHPSALPFISPQTLQAPVDRHL